MGNREKGTELPISVVDRKLEVSTDTMFGEWMAQLMTDIERAIDSANLTTWSDISELENIVEDVMQEKGAFVVSLEQGWTKEEWTVYMKHTSGGKDLYFAIWKRSLSKEWNITYIYDAVFKVNFVNKLQDLILQKKSSLALIDEQSQTDLWVLEEELLNPETIDQFVASKMLDAKNMLDRIRADWYTGIPSLIVNVNSAISLLYKITYAVDLLCSHPEYVDKCTSYKEELARLYVIKWEIEKRKEKYEAEQHEQQNQVNWRSTTKSWWETLPEWWEALKKLMEEDFAAIEREFARTDTDAEAKGIIIRPMLVRVHGAWTKLGTYPDYKGAHDEYMEKYRVYGKQLQMLQAQEKIDYDRDVSYYVWDELNNNPAFRSELSALDKEFPSLSEEQRKQVALAAKYVTSDPELFMTTMAAIYGNEHHSKYLERYFVLVQKYNDGEISKIRADILALKAERAFNRKDLGTVREARVDAKQAGITLKENKKREKYVRKMLRCVLQAEASERRTKIMLDIAARVKSGDVWSNALPLPNMNFWETAYYPQNPGSSLLWTTLSGMWYTSLDQIPKELFDGIDMTLFPELTTVPYTMNLEWYLNPDIKKEARGEITDDSRIAWNMESFGDAELMDRFALIVNSKDRYEKDKYPDGWMPVFQEVAKRYLTQDLNVLAFMQTYGREESKQKELLETCLFTLVDDTVIDEMRIRWFGYGAITKDDEILKEHIIGHIFVKSVMKHHNVDPSREERMKSKLAEAFGGWWNNNEGYEWNDKVGRIINEHIASLPKQPYGWTDRGGSRWLDKSLEAKDFLYTADGSWGWVNRALNMGIIWWLTSLWISPENAAGVAGAVKLVWGWLLAFMAIKWWYNNFRKWQSFTNKLWKNALLVWGLYALPRALTNKSLGELWNFAMHGDRNKTWLVPWPLLQKFGMDAKLKTNPDEFQTEFETGIAFWPMTLGAMGKYLKHKDGKFRLEGQDLKNFFHAPETEVPRQSKEQIARLLSTCKNNERRLSDYLTQWLIRSWFAADWSNFVKLTTTDPYQTKTFEELQRSHMEIVHLEDMFDGILGDEATKTELSTWYVWLSEDEKVKAAERIAEVKEFQTKRKEATPYVTFLLHRKELRPGPAGSLLEHMDDAKADALAAGLKGYATKKWAYAKQYIMDPATVSAFDDFFFSDCGAWSDIAKLMYADDGLQKLKEYEKVAGTGDFMETFVADYTKDRRCWTRKRSGVDMNMHNIVLKNIPWISGEIMLSNEVDPSDRTKTKLSIRVKNTTLGVWEEFHRKEIHDTPVHSPSLWMDTSSTSLWFYMKLWTGPGGTAPAMPDSFSDQFFPGMITHLQKGETEFRIKEDWLSVWTAPTWIRDTKNTGIWKVDPDIPAKLLWPKMVFEKTGKTMPD